MVKAAVIKKFGAKFEIEEFLMPELDPNSILLEIKLAMICGSDLHKFRGEWFWPTPLIPGHEGTGSIYKLGDNVKNDYVGKPLAEGDRIVYSSYYHCGKCFYCVKGEPTMCVNRQELGGTLTCDKPPYLTGAFAEYIYLGPVFPIFKAPEELSYDVLAPLNCACATVVHGLEKIGLKTGDYVVVLGAGGVGLYAVALAKALNVSKLIVLDKISERLRLAEEFGADCTINIGEYNSEERIKKVVELSNWGYGADLVIDVSGRSSLVMPEGLQMLRKGGRFLEIGGDSDLRSSIPIASSSVFPESKNIIGIRNFSPRHLLQALNFLEKNIDRFPFGKMVSHKFKLDDVNKAFELAGSGEAIRVGLTP